MTLVPIDAVLAHALPESVGAVPLTVILTVLIGLYLGANAVSTRRVGATIGSAAPTVVRRPSPIGATDLPAVPQTVGVLGLVLLAVFSTLGSSDAAENLTDVVALTLLWGVVGVSSILAGPWWDRVDPLRSLSRMAAVALGEPDRTDHPPLPDRVALGAAAALLLAWASVQLLVNTSVLLFQLLLIGYVVIGVSGATRYGLVWLTQTESLTVLSRTMGLLRPGDGGPLVRLTALADSTRLRVISSIVIGWSLADLLLETEWWHDLAIVGPFASFIGALLLFGTIAALYGLLAAVSSRVSVGPAFVAVAGGWVVAHYLSILLIDGQGLFIWLSDPLDTGANYLGLAGQRVNPEPIPLGLLAAIQSIPFALGHLAAVVIIQRRAARVVTDLRQLGPATFLARTLVAVLLLGGIYLQLGGL